MSKTKFDDLCNLEPGRFDWKIKVRIIRLWRGVRKKGEIFKGFNIMLLDKKNNRIHAFVPSNSADKLEPDLTIGKVCVIRKFTVQEYRMEDKFRCLRNNAQLIFSNDTQIKPIEDDGKSIEQNAFDFYDHSELMELTKQTTYLADVVGIIKYYQPLADLVNKRGNAQKKVKFTITDGRSSVNVTFWDAFAEKFQEQMNQVSEEPVIVIIESSRVGLWNDQIDISSVGGTVCYLNYNHYSVLQLRKKLTEPVFSQQMYVVDKNRELELLKVEEIKKLGKDYIMREVCTHVTIKSVEETQKWYSTVCTDCDQEIELEADNWFCMNCNRILPYPDKKFHITAVASDETGTFHLSLADQPTRAVLEKRAVQLLKEVEKEEVFPADFKKLRKEKFTVKIVIKEVNVMNNAPIYKVTSICRGFINPNSKGENTDTMDDTMEADKTQASTSTYHLDGMSQLNFQSPMITTTSRE